MCDFDLSAFRGVGLLVHAFLAGGDPHHLEPLWVSLNFEDSVLQEANVSSSSSSSSSSMTTTRSAMDLVVSRSSRDDLGGALDMGELEALGVPHPFWGVGTLMLKGFLKKV